MRNKAITVLASMIVASGTLAFAHGGKTFTGTVSDSMCGAKHMTKDKTAAECARACVKDGSYALVVGEKVYTLIGKKEEIGRFAGAKAVIEGDLDGSTIKVESIQAAK